MKTQGVNTVFHYVPLHSSVKGKISSKNHDDLSITDNLSDRLVRLPLWIGVEEYQNEIIEKIYKCLLESN